MRAPARHPFLDHPGPLAFAHRGGTEGGAENSMAAFAAAVALGFRYLETDAQATSDGVLVAFHDPTLDRLCGRPGRVDAMTWTELRQVRLVDGSAIPRLDELLGTWPEVRVNIDPKSDAVAALLPDVLRRTGALDRICLGSFSDRRLARLRAELGPGLCTSAGPVGVARHWAFGGRWPGSAHCLQIPPRFGRLTLTTPRFIAAAKAIGLPVHVWTVNDADEMRRLLALGVDGLMSDRPSLLKEVLEGLGRWST